MASRSFQDARVLLTGASSGIGRELAVQLAAEGARLLLTARREDRLQLVAESLRALGAEVDVVAGDITDPAHRVRLVDHAQRTWSAVDVLVNNAGVGGVGPFADSAPERVRQVMEVNFFGPVELTRECLPLLSEGTRPVICNVSSVLGHRAVPDKSEYCASKFALHGFSDALRAELSPSGIDVVLVSPSTTDSEFFDSLVDDPAAAKRAAMSADAVARAALRAIRRGRHEVILSWGGKLLVWADRLLPTLMDNLVAKFRR